jgi:hypothetical protein
LRRRSLLVLAALSALALVLLSGCAPARYPSYYNEQAEIDDVEYLDSYGMWIYLPSYGMVWSPDVVLGWQPFYYGHWIWTADGWAWASYEPYGWLVYHYGFWGYLPDIGWFWVPGDTWYPARVEWYTLGDYAGWAPLPPPGIVWVDPWDPYDIDVWIVIGIDDFTSENVGRYRVERSIYQNRIDRRIVSDRAPYTREIEEATRKRVPVVKVQEQPNYMRHRTVREQQPSNERTVKEPVESRERSETELKRVILPEVEKRRVERNAPRVEKEVLKRRTGKGTSSKRTSEDKRDTTQDKRGAAGDKRSTTDKKRDATEDARKRK